MASLGATCAHTQTKETRDLTKADWDTQRFGWICTSGDTFAEKKIELESLCARPGSCTIPEAIIKRRVSDFLDTVDKLSQKIHKTMRGRIDGRK